MSSWFCIVLLYAAIKTKKKKVVDKLFEYNNFLICEVEFPPNMIVGEIHQYVVQKFLQNKYELSRENLPKTWISFDVLKEFLDSCIKFQNNFYKIDFRFILPFYKHGKSLSDENDWQKYIYSEDYHTIKYILNDNNLKSLVTHPVMEIIIRVKYKKYAKMFKWHFFAFLIYYVAPSIGFAYSYQKFGSNWLTLLMITISSIYISICNYFKNVINGYSNQSIRMSDIFDKYLSWVSFFILVLTILGICDIYEKIDKIELYGELHTQTLKISKTFIAFFEIVNVILIIIASTFFIPCFKFPIFMKSFRKVITTLIHVFIIFLPLIISCATLLFLIYHKDSEDSDEEQKDSKKKEDSEKEKFQTILDSILHFTIMTLTDIEIETVISVKWIVSILVIMLTVSQSNLLTSVIIDDIGKLMEASEKYNLVVMAEKYIETAKLIKDFQKNNPR